MFCLKTNILFIFCNPSCSGFSIIHLPLVFILWAKWFPVYFVCYPLCTHSFSCVACCFFFHSSGAFVSSVNQKWVFTSICCPLFQTDFFFHEFLLLKNCLLLVWLFVCFFFMFSCLHFFPINSIWQCSALLISPLQHRFCSVEICSQEPVVMNCKYSKTLNPVSYSSLLYFPVWPLKLSAFPGTDS